MPEEATNTGPQTTRGEHPPATLRKALHLGAIAALLSGGLSAAGAALGASRGEAVGFTLATGLMLLAVVPQLVVFAAFLRLADALDGKEASPLRRSCICVFGSVWLGTAFAALTDFFPDPGGDAVLVGLLAMGIGLAAFLGYAVKGYAVILLWAAFLASRYLGGRLVIGKAFDLLVGLAVTACVLLVLSLVCYPTWFAVSLLRARGRLGGRAALLGWVILTTVAATVAIAGWAVVSVVVVPAAGPMDEQGLDHLLATHLQRLAWVGVAEAVLVAVATAAFFLGVRQRVGRLRAGDA